MTGAVQAPPDGDPVVLIPDHATLGGYPVVAVVASADHGLLGQCAPGTRCGRCPSCPPRRTRHDTGAGSSSGAVAGTYPLTVD